MKKILIILMILSVFFDFSVTLWGQPGKYWQGGDPNEENPIGVFLLTKHPLYFILFTIPWVLFLAIGIKWLVFPLDFIFGMGIIAGHLLAASSWIPKVFPVLPSPKIYFLFSKGAPEWYLGGLFILLIFLIQLALKRSEEH